MLFRPSKKTGEYLRESQSTGAGRGEAIIPGRFSSYIEKEIGPNRHLGGGRDTPGKGEKLVWKKKTSAAVVSYRKLKMLPSGSKGEVAELAVRKIPYMSSRKKAVRSARANLK